MYQFDVTGQYMYIFFTELLWALRTDVIKQLLGQKMTEYAVINPAGVMQQYTVYFSAIIHHCHY